MPPQGEILIRILRRNTRNFHGIDDNCALGLQNFDRLRHRGGLFRRQRITPAATPTASAARARLRPAHPLGQLRALIEHRPRDPDARAFQSVRLQKLRVIPAWRRCAQPGCRIVGIGRRALQRAQQDCGVRHRLRHGTRRILIGRNRDDSVAADPAHRRLHRREHGLIRRTQDGPRRFAPHISGPEIGGRADTGTRPAGLQHRTAVVRTFPRVFARIVRIESETAHGVVISGHWRGRAGHPVGQFGKARLRDNDCAGVPQIFHQRGVVRRHVTLERQRPAGGHDVVREYVIFQGDGNPVQRPAHPALRPFAIALVRLFQRIRIHRDDAVQLVLIQADARQIKRHQFAGRQALCFERRAHFRNARFHHIERRRSRQGCH